MAVLKRYVMQTISIVTKDNLYKRTKEIILIKHSALSKKCALCIIYEKGLLFDIKCNYDLAVRVLIT